MNIIQTLIERVDKIGTEGYMGIFRLFVGTPYEIKIMRLSPDEDFTLHLPRRFSPWPIKENSSRDVVQWVIDIKRRAMRDGEYIEIVIPTPGPTAV